MLDLTQPFFSNMLNLVPSASVHLATSVSLGDLQSGQIGSIVPRPTLTPNGSYTSVTWASSDYNVIDISTTPAGLKLVSAGKATITATLKDEDGKTLATVSKEYTVTAPVAAPVFTTQPGTNATTGTANSQTHTAVLFQPGGTMTISGAAATGATSWQWQWQKQNGTDWADVQQATPGPILTIANAKQEDEGIYRVLAINSGGSVTSNPIETASCYLFVQNLYASTHPEFNPVQDAHDLTKYTIAAKAGDNISLIFLIRKTATPTVNYMGITATVKPAITADTSNAAVATAVLATDPRQVDLHALTAAPATINVHLGALDAEITLTIS